MTYDEALRFWYSRVDFERTRAHSTDLKLEQMQDLLSRMGNPQDQLRIVHIAGSKGKGSTAAMFAAVSQAAGLKTGLYTSPHLIDVRERIQVDGQPISQADVAALLSELRPHVEAVEASSYALTFFEIATALGFLHFARQGVQLAIIEVGLGGRFDSTNVCTPALAVITSISLEHTAILGNTLGEIAFEKAGIIKPGGTVISGVVEPEAAAMIRQIAVERGATLVKADEDFQFDSTSGKVSRDGAITKARVTVTTKRRKWIDIEINLLGSHQAANAALVVAGGELLARDEIVIDERSIRSGLAGVTWPARLHVFPGRPVVVLDCAHNPASANTLVETLTESLARGQRTLVFACSSDKDVGGMMAVFAKYFEQFIFTRYHLNPRSLPTDELANALRGVRGDLTPAIIDDPVAAVEAARTSTTDLVVIAGSTYLAGEVLPHLTQ